MPDTSGPFVQIATFCQTAMVENNGVVSFIRITDRVAVPGMTPEMKPTPIQITLAVIIKSGFLRGNAKITVHAITPSEQHLPPLEFPALFEGDERGVQILMPLAFVATEQGLYWFEVKVEDAMLTRIPLRVLYQQIHMPPGGIAVPGMPSGM